MVSGPRQTGMTLIELMIVVVIVGVLAAVAIVGYNRYTRQAKSTEVRDIFNRMATAEANYQSEFGRYYGTGGFFPTSVGSQATNLGALPAEWQRLKLDPGKSSLYCQYQAIAGTAGSDTGMDSLGTAIYGSTPTTAWYYLEGQCDFDGDGTYSVYAMRHDRTEVYKEREGE